MAFDGYFCFAVASELKLLIGAKVEKLHQSCADELDLYTYKNGEHKCLIISSAPSSPIVAAVETETIHPDTPSSFCMFMRKHFLGSVITDVSAIYNERIIKFVFECHDELGYAAQKSIYAEIMGKYSNIIVCDAEDIIIGAIHQSDITNTTRRIMVGFPYELPPAQNKTDMQKISKDDFLRLLADNPDKPADRLLLQTFFALSPVVAREIVCLASKQTDTAVRDIDGEKLFFYFNILREKISNNDFNPTIVKTADGKCVEYSYIDIIQYGHSALISHPKNFSELLVSFFAEKSRAERIKQYTGGLLKLLSNISAKLAKKQSLIREELADCEKMEYYKNCGQLLLAEIYRIKRGDKLAVVYDYQSETELSIPLDTRISVADNAQRYFKKYQKLKHAKSVLTEQLALAENESLYIDSVFDSLTRAESEQDFNEIRDELIQSGYCPQKSSLQKKKQKLSRPLEFKTARGLTVRVGKNNRQNDIITSSAAKNDVWFHVKGYPGSHTVLYTNGEEPTLEDCLEAATLAAAHSKAASGKNIPVDYTLVRYVKKPNGAKPGFVIYDKQKTLIVNP